MPSPVPNRHRPIPLREFRAKLTEEFGDRLISVKKFSYNTAVYELKDPEVLVYRYTDTDIVKVQNGDMTFDSGGFRTPTTLIKMNEAISQHNRGFSIYQRDRIWRLHLANPRGAQEWYYADGMVITKAGKVRGALVRSVYDAKVKRLEKRIKDYLKYVRETLKKGWPTSMDGDPWCCLMVTESGESMGEVQGDVVHLVNHMRHRYFFLALLARAIHSWGRDPRTWIPLLHKGNDVSMAVKILAQYLRKMLYPTLEAEMRRGL